MKRTLRKLSATFLGILALTCALEAEPVSPPARLLVKWKDGPTSASAAEANARLGARVKRNFNALGWQLVELPPGLSEADGLKAYQAFDSVASVEPDRRVPWGLPPTPETAEPLADAPAPSHRVALSGPTPASATPNDPKFNQQWYLKKISAPEAWGTTTGNSNVVVAVMDTGVNYNHQDLRANMWRNPGEAGLDGEGRDKATNAVDDDGNGYVDDVYGIDVLDHDSDPMEGDWSYTHGTACASILGAAGNDGTGMVGVNWQVSIMAVRFLRFDATLAQVLEGLDYLLTMKHRGVNLRVVNMSFFTVSWAPTALREAYEALGAAGILQVGIAGNWGRDLEPWPVYPASWRVPSMIVVGGSDTSDRFWNSSDFGPSTVDLVAPSMQMTMAWGATPSAYSATGDGTSFAAPQVAGAAALLLAQQPHLTVDQLKAAIFGSVDLLPALKGKVATNGRLNVARALEYLTNPNPVPIVVSASPRGQLTPAQAPIQMTFNRPMNRATVENALVITPPIAGAFDWADDNRSFSFQHEATFDITIKYAVRLLATAQDEAGQMLDGNYNRQLEGSPNDDFVWAFDFPLSNDNFPDAQPLSGASGVVVGNNSRATVDEEAEWAVAPEGWTTFATSLWYRWSPPGTEGWYTFDLTSGTTFNALLAIYAGDRLADLSVVAANDDYGTRTASRVSFPAQSGMTYSVFLASRNSAVDPTQVGPFKLFWYPTPAPGFTGSQFSPLRGMPGAKVVLTGTNFTGATAVLFGQGSAAFVNAPSNNVDLRITATVPPDATSGPITVVTPHGSVTSTATFQLLPPPLMVRWTPEGRVEISWPATSAELGLESAAQAWTPVWEWVAALPQKSEGRSRVLVDGVGAARFFRLRGAP